MASNSGRFTRDAFAVVPEAQVQLGYQLTGQLRAFVGYNFLYVSEVVRPGDQIDRVVDIRQVPLLTPTPALVASSRPAVPFHMTDYWAQGVTFGMAFRY